MCPLMHHISCKLHGWTPSGQTLYISMYNTKTRNVLSCKTEEKNTTLGHFTVCLKEHHGFLQLGLNFNKSEITTWIHSYRQFRGTLNVQMHNTKRTKTLHRRECSGSSAGGGGAPSGWQWARSNHHVLTPLWPPRHHLPSSSALGEDKYFLLLFTGFTCTCFHKNKIIMLVFALLPNWVTNTKQRTYWCASCIW